MVRFLYITFCDESDTPFQQILAIFSYVRFSIMLFFFFFLPSCFSVLVSTSMLFQLLFPSAFKKVLLFFFPLELLFSPVSERKQIVNPFLLRSKSNLYECVQCLKTYEI